VADYRRRAGITPATGTRVATTGSLSEVTHTKPAKHHADAPEKEDGR
jgi:hypothetical protein